MEDSTRCQKTPFDQTKVGKVVDADVLWEVLRLNLWVAHWEATLFQDRGIQGTEVEV